MKTLDSTLEGVLERFSQISSPKITDDIIAYKEEIFTLIYETSPEQWQALFDKILKQLSFKGYHDPKILFLIRLIERLHSPLLIPTLRSLFTLPQSALFQEDICHVMSHFHTPASREFLEQHLAKPALMYRCAVGLYRMGVQQVEELVLHFFHDSLLREQVNTEVLRLLIEFSYEPLWEELYTYMHDRLVLEEFYKIYLELRSCDTPQVIPVLVKCHQVFSRKSDDDFKNLGPMYLDQGMVLIHAFSKAKTVRKRILLEIEQRLESFSHHEQARSYLERISQH